MRPLQAPADVLLRDDQLVEVRWQGPGGAPGAARITRLIDDWDYVGRRWADEIRRHYLLVESDDGRWLEVYRQDGRWWVSRVNG